MKKNAFVKQKKKEEQETWLETIEVCFPCAELILALISRLVIITEAVANKHFLEICCLKDNTIEGINWENNYEGKY